MQFPTPRGAVLDLHISGLDPTLKQDDFVGIGDLCHGGDMWAVMYAEEVATMQHPRLRVYKLYISRNKIRWTCLFFPHGYFRIRDCRFFFFRH